MAVYVDDLRAMFGRMVMCHMIADSSEELVAMAVRIGMKPEWIQKPGTHREHFDVSLTRRREAIKHGALPITTRELGRLVLNRDPKYLAKYLAKLEQRKTAERAAVKARTND